MTDITGVWEFNPNGYTGNFSIFPANGIVKPLFSEDFLYNQIYQQTIHVVNPVGLLFGKILI